MANEFDDPRYQEVGRNLVRAPKGPGFAESVVVGGNITAPPIRFDAPLSINPHAADVGPEAVRRRWAKIRGRGR
jgi:hypothetical protein